MPKPWRRWCGAWVAGCCPPAHRAPSWNSRAPKSRSANSLRTSALSARSWKSCAAACWEFHARTSDCTSSGEPLRLLYRRHHRTGVVIPRENLPGPQHVGGGRFADRDRAAAPRRPRDIGLQRLHLGRVEMTAAAQMRPCGDMSHAAHGLANSPRFAAPAREFEPIDVRLQLFKAERALLETDRAQQRRRNGLHDALYRHDAQRLAGPIRLLPSQPIRDRRWRSIFQIEREILIRGSAARNQQQISRQPQTAVAHYAPRRIEQAVESAIGRVAAKILEEFLQMLHLALVQRQRATAVDANIPPSALDLAESIEQVFSRAAHGLAQ